MGPSVYGSGDRKGSFRCRPLLDDPGGQKVRLVPSARSGRQRPDWVENTLPDRAPRPGSKSPFLSAAAGPRGPATGEVKHVPATFRGAAAAAFPSCATPVAQQGVRKHRLLGPVEDVGLIDGAGVLSTGILNAISGGGGGNAPNMGRNFCNPIGSTWFFQYWHRLPAGAPSSFLERTAGADPVIPRTDARPYFAARSPARSPMRFPGCGRGSPGSRSASTTMAVP